MFTRAEQLRMAALVIFVLGLTCLPLPRMNPKLALNAMAALAPAGWFIGLGVVLMAVSALLLLLSFVVRQ
jgi:hypothetical protein